MSFGAGGQDFFVAKLDSNGRTCRDSVLTPAISPLTLTVMSATPTVIDVVPNVEDVSFNKVDVTPEVLRICSSGISEMLPKRNATKITAAPNPFNSSCRIAINNLEGTLEKVLILDTKGRVVDNISPTTSIYKAKTSEFIWQPKSSISSGLYILLAKDKDSKTIAKKLFYLK